MNISHVIKLGISILITSQYSITKWFYVDNGGHKIEAI